jgi:hypothetical protein
VDVQDRLTTIEIVKAAHGNSKTTELAGIPVGIPHKYKIVY